MVARRARLRHVQPLFNHDEPRAIRALFRVMNRYVGNLAPMPGVFPDYPAPVVRNADTERELSNALGHAATAARRRAPDHQHQERP